MFLNKAKAAGASSKLIRPPYFKKYNSWRIRVLCAMIIGYATFYLCRQNFNIAMPLLMREFNVTKTELGVFLSIASILYGFGKFINGFISDRTNARIFFASALFLVAVVTIASSFAASGIILCMLWIVNNWFQSMGWPPIAKMLTNWFSQKELGTKWAIGATSHQLGAALAMLLCGYLVDSYNWRYAFFIPGFIALLISIWLFNRLRNDPRDLGLPSVEEYKSYGIDNIDTVKNPYANLNHSLQNLDAKNFSSSFVSTSTDLKTKLSIIQLFKMVFFNKFMWCLSIANMALYVVRHGMIFWAPSFLSELNNTSLYDTGIQIAIYEILGLVGGISAGFLSDRLFNRNRGVVAAIFMIFLSIALLIFCISARKHQFLNFVAMVFCGFCVYGPQVLVGIACTDCVNKVAIGTANGFVSIFGYLGAGIAGICVGLIADNFNWNAVFAFFICCSLIGAFFFALFAYNIRLYKSKP